MKEDEVFYTRRFLNNEERGGIALVEARIYDVTKSNCFDATLKIGDCNRIVELDFGCWSKDSVPIIRQKIATLRRTLVAFEAVLIAQLNQIEKETP